MLEFKHDISMKIKTSNVLHDVSGSTSTDGKAVIVGDGFHLCLE